MRALRWPLRVVAFVVLVYVYFAALHPHYRAPDHVFFDAPGPWVIAHRGGGQLWPGNTLFAFEKAYELGVDLIEMDLRITADGHIVALHDRTVDRTTDGRGTAAEMTLEQIQKLDAGYRFPDAEGESFPFRERGIRVPTLREILTTLPDVKLNVEMKGFTADQAVSLCRVLRAFDVESRVLVASFELEPMEAFREACPVVATSATFRETLMFYALHRLRLSSLYESPAVAFQVPETFRDLRVIEPSFLARAERTNIRVQVWTVNHEDDMTRLLEMGVHGILTDYPDQLMSRTGRAPPSRLSETSPATSADNAR